MARKAIADGGDLYGPVAANKVAFKAGEPVMLIRATDPFAVPIVVEYARKLEREGVDRKVADAVFDQAMAIAGWQRENPELISNWWEDS